MFILIVNYRSQEEKQLRYMLVPPLTICSMNRVRWLQICKRAAIISPNESSYNCFNPGQASKMASRWRSTHVAIIRSSRQYVSGFFTFIATSTSPFRNTRPGQHLIQIPLRPQSLPDLLFDNCFLNVFQLYVYLVLFWFFSPCSSFLNSGDLIVIITGHDLQKSRCLLD